DGSGFYAAQLSAGTPFPPSLWDGNPRFLGITVEGEMEMTPRQPVVSVPYALRAAVAVDAVGDIHPTSITVNGKLIVDANAGTASFVSGTCNTVGNPCVIDISRANFTAPPVCLVSFNNIDATGYTERMPIKRATTTQLQIWKGNFGDTGTTMIVNYLCVDAI